MHAWLGQHGSIFGEVHEALLATASAAGDAARAIEADAPQGEVRERLAEAAVRADAFIAVLDQAAALPPIPDAVTARHFRLSLAQWRVAAETARTATRHQDASAMNRVAHDLGAGVKEFLQSAAALRRAISQAPDRGHDSAG